MIRLDTTTRKLQIKLGGAVATNQLPVLVCWTDVSASAYTGGSTSIDTNSTTAVDICAAPAASTIRDIDSITVQNADTVAATVTIIYNDNATLRTVVKVALAVGDQLIFTHGQGWKVVDSAGNTKIIQAPSANLIATTINTATNKATPVDADELGIWDSVSGILNKLTWANLKATLATYFGSWIQVQTATAFTTGGTSTAFTLTPTPASAANATGQRFRVNFNAAAGATPTLAVSGQTAENLKYKNYAGVKQAVTAVQVYSGLISDVEYDGTDWVVLEPAVADYDKTTWTPTPTGFTGSLSSITGNYVKLGSLIFYTINAAGTSIVATGNSSTITLPISPSLRSTASCVGVSDENLGSGVNYTDGKVYVPAMGGIAGFTISGVLFV